MRMISVYDGEGKCNCNFEFGFRFTSHEALATQICSCSSKSIDRSSKKGENCAFELDSPFFSLFLHSQVHKTTKTHEKKRHAHAHKTKPNERERKKNCTQNTFSHSLSFSYFLRPLLLLLLLIFVFDSLFTQKNTIHPM